MPEECLEGATVTLWQTFLSAFTITTDPCAAYYEKLLVDPMWEVSPTQVSVVRAGGTSVSSIKITCMHRIVS